MIQVALRLPNGSKQLFHAFDVEHEELRRYVQQEFPTARAILISVEKDPT